MFSCSCQLIQFSSRRTGAVIFFGGIVLAPVVGIEKDLNEWKSKDGK
jgi:hypothetical protein